MSSKCNGPQSKDYHSYQYEETCENCGRVHYLETQEDNDAEYETAIYLKCECGENLCFMLPVN